jgi:hypothetical protein
MVEKRIYDGSARVSRRGMHDHSSRLVQDDQVAVLVDDVEREILSLDPEGLGRRHIDLEALAFRERLGLLHRAPVNDNPPLFNELVHTRSG